MSKPQDQDQKRREVFDRNYEGDLGDFIAQLGKLSDQPLTPDELKRAYLNAIEFFEKKSIPGVEIVWPAGFKIGGQDVGGYGVISVLQHLIAQLVHYEPQLSADGEVIGENAADQIPARNTPAWLQDFEHLTWKNGGRQSFWEVEATAYHDEVKLVYKKGSQRLEPGKPADGQIRQLEAIKHHFSLAEWLVIKPVIDEYLKTEKQMRAGPANLTRTARRKVLEVLREENGFRTGQKKDRPKIIRKRLEDSIEKIVLLKRWEDEDRLNMLGGIDRLASQVADLLSQLVVLNSNRAEAAKLIPDRDPAIKETPTFMSSMRKLLKCFDYQLGAGQGGVAKGLSLLLGEPGVGKNELVKYAAYALNRPYFWFPCGRGMEAQDLIHHYEFDSKEGTRKFFTALAEGLQTPGAIVFVDEANALKPQVQAILHGVGDSNRTIRYDGMEIPVALGVVVVLGGNPATQGSAGNFGEPILSRSRGQAMIMNYPSLTRGDFLAREEHWSDADRVKKETADNTLRHYSCDEVLAMYGLFNEFKGTTDLEFEYLWERLVNEKPVLVEEKFAGIDKKKMDQVVERDDQEGHDLRRLLNGLRDILRVVDLWRKSFERREVMIGVSLRDTIALTQAYQRTKDVRQAFLEVFDDFRKNPMEGLDVMYMEMTGMLDKVLKTRKTTS